MNSSDEEEEDDDEEIPVLSDSSKEEDGNWALNQMKIECALPRSMKIERALSDEGDDIEVSPGIDLRELLKFAKDCDCGGFEIPLPPGLGVPQRKGKQRMPRWTGDKSRKLRLTIGSSHASHGAPGSCKKKPEPTTLGDEGRNSNRSKTGAKEKKMSLMKKSESASEFRIVTMNESTDVNAVGRSWKNDDTEGWTRTSVLSTVGVWDRSGGHTVAHCPGP